MRKLGAVLLAVAILLAGCGGSSYSAGDAASLMEAQNNAKNVICKHRDEDPGTVFRCRAHRNDQPWAAMRTEIKFGKVIVNSCYAVRFRPHPPPSYKPPCSGIDFNRTLHSLADSN